MFLFHAEGRLRPARAALNRALEIAEAADATALIAAHPVVARCRARSSCGQIGEGFSFLDRASAVAEATGDDLALLRLAATGSDALLKLGRSRPPPSWRYAACRPPARPAARPALWHLAGRQRGRGAAGPGRTAEAATLIDPLTTGPPGRDHWAWTSAALRST